MSVRVVVAPDKFKGSLTAAQAAAALGRGLTRAGAAVVEHPIADGGEGTVAVALAHGFTPVTVPVRGPLGRPRTATMAMSADGSTALVEAAEAAGLGLLGDTPSPHTAWRASTHGVGELIAAALERGASRIIVAVGGSATTDGGIGALVALGARVLDRAGEPVPPGARGLAEAHRLDVSGIGPGAGQAELVVATDVDNPLTGPAGAAAAYSRQKGATADMVPTLDAGLRRWADTVAATTGRDPRDEPGMGAAGGLAFGLAAVLGARLTSGVDLLLDLTRFADRVASADLVVVGEGSLDEQSLRGKGPLGVARAAARHGVPVVAVAGRSTADPDQLRRAGITKVYTLADREPDPERSMREAGELVERIGEQIARESTRPPATPRRGMDKVVASAAAAVADVRSGARLAVGGFGLCGIPSALIEAVLRHGVSDLEVVSNNCGVDDWGLGLLLSAGRIRRIVASYVGENKEFARAYLAGELEVELTPQGTLAERMRAGGAGIPAFYTPTGVGTQIADGGLPWSYAPDGSVSVASPPKEIRRFDGREAVLETAIVADVSLVRAWRGDRHGNLVFRSAARNFNPAAAMCGRLCVAEVEELVEPGGLDPDQVHLPGVYVHRVVPLAAERVAEKRIEKRIVRKAGA